jgi:hypothetical protein
MKGINMIRKVIEIDWKKYNVHKGYWIVVERYYLLFILLYRREIYLGDEL